MARIKTFSNGGAILPTDLNSIQDYIDSQDAANVANDELLRTLVGANNIAGSIIRRGKSIISTTGARTNTAYGFLSDGADRVSGIVLPTDGLICVLYQATWQESVAAAARASIFIGSNQLVTASPAGGTGNVAAMMNTGATSRDTPLFSHPGGLASLNGASSYSGDLTTGQVVGGFGDGTSSLQVDLYGGSSQRTFPYTGATANNAVAVGGPCYVFAAAGTYDISVQFKSSSGSVTVKNRKLWVWSVNF